MWRAPTVTAVPATATCSGTPLYNLYFVRTTGPVQERLPAGSPASFCLGSLLPLYCFSYLQSLCTGISPSIFLFFKTLFCTSHPQNTCNAASWPTDWIESSFFIQNLSLGNLLNLLSSTAWHSDFPKLRQANIQNSINSHEFCISPDASWRIP